MAPLNLSIEGVQLLITIEGLIMGKHASIVQSKEKLITYSSGLLVNNSDIFIADEGAEKIFNSS